MDCRLSSIRPTPLIKYSSSLNRQNNGFCSKFLNIFKLGRKSKKGDIDDVSNLIAGIGKLTINNKSALKSAKSTKSAAKSLAKWGEKGRNSAIEDVVQKTSQLMQLHADKQIQYAHDYELSLKKLRMVADSELSMKKSVKRLEKARAKEHQLQTKVRKLIANGEDTVLFRRKLDEAILYRESAERNLANERAEIEVVKMFQFREAMMAIAEAQRVLAAQTLAICNCHKEITQFVPAVSTQNVNIMMYEGAAYTQEYLDELNRFPSVCPVHSSPISENTSENIAPPPYSSIQPIRHQYTPLAANVGEPASSQPPAPKINFRGLRNKRAS